MKNDVIQNCFSSETHNWYMYTMWEIEPQNLWLTQMPSQGEMADRKIFVCLSTYRLLWNNLWSVNRYVIGPLSGPWRQSGNDHQCLAAPIWKYRSGFGDHRFTFFIDLRPNYTFYTNLTNIVHWVVAYRDVAHLVRLNLGKSWEKSAKSFDAGLRLDKLLINQSNRRWVQKLQHSYDVTVMSEGDIEQLTLCSKIINKRKGKYR